MKKLYKTVLLATLLMINYTSITHAKHATVYGIHDPIDTNLGGIEWIFIITLVMFFSGLVLVVNGRTLKNKIS